MINILSDQMWATKAMFSFKILWLLTSPPQLSNLHPNLALEPEPATWTCKLPMYKINKRLNNSFVPSSFSSSAHWIHKAKISHCLEPLNTYYTVSLFLYISFQQKPFQKLSYGLLDSTCMNTSKIFRRTIFYSPLFISQTLSAILVSFFRSMMFYSKDSLLIWHHGEQSDHIAMFSIEFVRDSKLLRRTLHNKLTKCCDSIEATRSNRTVK